MCGIDLVPRELYFVNRDVKASGCKKMDKKLSMIPAAIPARLPFLHR
jgi:hypothetical protein